MKKTKIKFEPKHLLENTSYLSDDTLIRLFVYDLPVALDELLSREKKTITNILETPSFEAEQHLKEKIFSKNEDFIYSKLFSSSLEKYRGEGRDFFRRLSFNAEKIFSKKKRVFDVDRFIYVVGLSPYESEKIGDKKYYFEDMHALLRVRDWSQIESLEDFLEDRKHNLGRAFIEMDMIYSHKDEKYDEEGYVLYKNQKRMKFLQVSEGLMFRDKLSEEQKRHIEEDIIKELMLELKGKKAPSNREISKAKNELEEIIHVGNLNEGFRYPSLFDAWFQTVAYTVKPIDQIDLVKINDPKRKSTLIDYGSGQKLANSLENIIVQKIAPPAGVVLFGWKGQSLADKLVIATYHHIIRENEEELRQYLKDKGINTTAEHYERRDMRDALRATFITWGENMPISDKEGLRDVQGEELAYSLFGYLHGLSEEEIIGLNKGKFPKKKPDFSSFGLKCEWNSKKGYKNRLINRKENQYGSLSTKSEIMLPSGNSHAEIVFKTNIDDRYAHISEKQSHALYKIEQQAIVDWLVDEKKVIPREELYALRMLISPKNTYIHF